MSALFDQALYDAVINEFPAYDHADPPDAYDVWEGAADIAARIAAERQATVPVVPESVTHWHVVVNGEHGPGFTVYTNCDTTTDCHTFDTWGYHLSDPAAALQAAIDQIGGAE